MKKEFKIKCLFNKRINFILFIFACFTVLFLIKNIFFKSSFEDKIIMLKEPKTEIVKLSAKALIVRDEYLYYLGENNIEVDNSKINVNKEIGQVDVSNIEENFKNYVVSTVNTLQKKLDTDSSKSEKLNIDLISHYVREKKYSDAFDFLSSKKEDVSFEKSYIKDKLFRYSILNDTFNTGKIVSKNSGLLSKNIDGLENIYDFSIINLIDESDFNFEKHKSSSIISGLKIVDNLKYYLCLKIGHDALQDIEVDSSLVINFGDKSHEGIVKNIKKNSVNDLFIVEFSSGFEEILDKRFIDVNVEKNFNKVYELPKSSLIQQNDENYIILLDSFNNMKKVKVVTKFIDNLNDKVYIDSVKSYIGPFSSVLKNADEVKEGEISK